MSELVHAVRRFAICCLSLVICHVTDTVDACMVCLPMPQVTAADRLIEAEVVAFARENPGQPFSYRAVEVLKGRLDSPEIDLFVNSSTRRQLQANGEVVSVLVRGKDQSWRSIGVADKVFQQVVRRVLAVSPQWSGERGAEERCQFFMTLIGHEDRTLFELAYLEMGRAPYDMIKRVAGLIPKERLQPILTRREYIEWRSLAILMLTQNAGESERRLVNTQFDERSRFALTTNLAAWVTAYIELNGADAIEAIDGQYFNNPSRSEAEIRAVVTAMSVHGRDGHTQLRDRIVRSYGIAIRNHPTVTGPISQDLADWGRYDYRPETREVLKRTDLNLQPDDRAAILRYLASPRTNRERTDSWRLCR
jgi:hypothetical protein